MTRRRRLQCGSIGVMLLAITAAFAAGTPGCNAANRPAFIVGAGSRVSVSARAARSSRTSRSRRAGLSRIRVGMQQDPPNRLGRLGLVEFPSDRPKEYDLKPGQVGVRFINTSGDPDVAIAAYPGETVTTVAKRAGVKIPTACKTGICGTCTTDLEDPNAESYRPGFQVVRACVTKVMLLPGTEEMVLDVYRNRSQKGNINKQLTKLSQDMEGVTEQTLGDVMKRFEDGWDEDFAPDYKGGTTKSGTKATSFAASLEDDTVQPIFSSLTQKRIENKHMYDDLPKQVKRLRPEGGRDLEEDLQKAHQLYLRRRLEAEKRERINYYLDNAHRPIASATDMLTLSETEIATRSRFFNQQPRRWEEAYGPANSPELDRELKESNGRMSDGASPARMALYRSAEQIPRYRFFGDPPLEETDEVATKIYMERTSKDIGSFDAAELDKLQWIQENEAQQNNKFVFRDSRVGRPVDPINAGKPSTVRGERRLHSLRTCSACEGRAYLPCKQCNGLGLTVSASGRLDAICPGCGGSTKVKCPACAGTSFAMPGK